MSEFSVHRTADTIPALKYCLILDGERIAGGKPDYRGNNHLISWSTRETYGPVDQLKAENAKLREQAARLFDKTLELGTENAKLRELAVLNWEWAHSCCGNSCKVQTEGCGYGIGRECNYEREIWDRMRELGVEVPDGD